MKHCNACLIPDINESHAMCCLLNSFKERSDNLSSIKNVQMNKHLGVHIFNQAGYLVNIVLKIKSPL